MRDFHPRLETACVFQATEQYPFNMECTLTDCADEGLLVSWTTGGHVEPLAGNFTRASRSHDGGQTWEEPFTLFSHPFKGVFTPRISRHGDTVYAFPGSYYDHSQFAEDFMCYVSESRDNGRTFSSPHTLSGAPAALHVKQTLEIGGRLLLFGSMREIVGDAWAAPTVGRSAKPCVVAGQSSPHGEMEQSMSVGYFMGQVGNWIFGNTIEEIVTIERKPDGRYELLGVVDADLKQMTEPTAVELADGRLKLLMRCNVDHRLYESESEDGGRTWTKAKRTDIPAPPSKARLFKDGRGRVLLLHNPCETTRTPLSLWRSDDGMETWREKIDLVRDSERWACYPDGFVDEKTDTLNFVWEDRANIWFSRFPLDD